MSLLNEHIDVAATMGGHPALFTWRGELYRVRRVIETWETAGETRTGPARGRLVRVASESDTGHASIADLAFDPDRERWMLRRNWS
ncbi:DUF6504 family protein [Lipingzhangella sp. LS1_29]|uniref:DUF6504 family protein n=1 Tax=Lipingzhangella rawalii TaxID=2055835 RepID=A0ABU2HBB7_9ACTN|nr:DUF6504 family protein [Lipingzhangella rawalii]MDS1271879.1 DUF6504 family protein [Lipingzhangella rawalii]